MVFLVQQPRSLESFAISNLADWVASQAHITLKHDAGNTELLSRQIETIRNHLKHKIPTMFHNSLAAELIQKLIKLSNQVFLDDMNIGKRIGRMIETLFTEKLTSLTFDQDIEMFLESLSSKSNMLTGVIDLKLLLIDDVLSDFASVGENDIIQILEQMHSLECFTLKGCSRFYNIDNILKCIAENCKLMEKLDLSSLTLKEGNIDLLIQLRNLRSIRVIGSRISAEGMATLLMACDNLEYICTYGIENALEYIASFEGTAEKRFKLRTYEGNYVAKLHQLELVAKMCPHIQKFTLKKGTSGNYLIVLMTHDLQDLRELELHYFRFHGDQLKNFFDVKGCILTHLGLYDVEQIDLNALICLTQSCPNLESLMISDCSFVKQSLEDDLLYCKIDELENPPFINLKRLTLHTSFWVPSPSDEQLIFLLSNCPNIEYIEIDDQFSPSDDIMSNVLDKNPLIYLKELRIYDWLSTAVIERIVHNCIRPLEVVVYDSIEITSNTFL